jgi:hypothetical protein
MNDDNSSNRLLSYEYNRLLYYEYMWEGKVHLKYVYPDTNKWVKRLLSTMEKLDLKDE